MQLKTRPQLDVRNKQTASTTTMQVKIKPQLDALNKQTASTTIVQVQKNSQLDAINKQAASTTIVQVKTKPQLDAPNKQAELRTIVQLQNKHELNAINQKLAASAKTYRQDLQPIKNGKSVATTDRQDLQPIKNRKSVAKTYQPHSLPIKEHKSGGFSLVELFIVFMIIGILSAIVLPELAKCKPYKAMQSEAKQYLSSVNKGQQAKYAEDGTFSNSITDLGIGLKTETTNYNYSAIATKNTAFSYGVARSNNLTSYVGAVFLVPTGGAMTRMSILCAANSPGKTQPPNPIIENGVPVCAAGSSEVPK